MMRQGIELGDVIAERRLVFHATAGWTRDVIVRVGRPAVDTSMPQQAWICPFQIRGLGDERVRGIYGIDAMQALLLAIHTIPAELASYVGEHGGNFLHLGRADAGFISPCRTALKYAGDAFPPDAF